MKDPLGVVIFSLVLLVFSFQAFIVWFKPKEHLKDMHERKIWFKSHFPIFPDWFISYIFFFEKPLLTIWWARIGLLIAVLLCILGVIVAFHGPF